jgi:hypothetical protein
MLIIISINHGESKALELPEYTLIVACLWEGEITIVSQDIDI